ncbi:biotin--[acetyl-CoA-carboxylase] ligase [Caldalkalibacillus mannanilyticus]|uniref:biotin--[acetyl-CoA-carboxylase] ligase n=1 Tax=Caldalkalibacillus mannanilyticus TaxID=1418 RepID=UPI00046AB786|nr:biotin--[acetyl-CoA-carboxylase] ligase [Caldalkalibacillus mannanilyticus]
MSSVRIQVLHQLLENEKEYLSGEELSKVLQISRTAVWKHIEELRKEGYVIEAQKKQGYRILEIPTTLSASTLLPKLSTKWLGHELHVYKEVESTQLIAQKLAREGAPSGTIVIADTQLAGKGRLGRKWYSPPGTGAWLSLILRPEIPVPSAPQLTLLAAVAILKGIRKVTPLEAGIKWPNDVLINGKKVAGILTELSAEADQINHVIVGVGINVSQEEKDFPEELQQMATSLEQEQGESIDRNDLIVSVLKEWEELYEMYIQYGFSPIKTLWEAYTVSLGKEIVARTLQGQYQGLALGITDEGVLLLQDREGVIHKIYSADIKTV